MNLKKKSLIPSLLVIQLLAGMLLVIHPSNANAQGDLLNLDEQLSSINNQTNLQSLFSTEEDFASLNSSSDQSEVTSPITTFPDGQDGKDGLAGQDETVIP